MDGNHLSDRLQQLANWVPAGSRVADIGSDHAYLPIYLANQERITFAVAGEVAKGPLAHSQAAIKAAGWQEKISARFGDGLAVITPEDAIDVITIAGMGGQLIVDILSQGKQDGKLSNHPALLLQPNWEAQRVRQWLNMNGYALIKEGLVEENKKRYEMMMAQYAPEQANLTAEEIQFGRFVEQANPIVFQAMWQHELAKAQRVLMNLENSTDTQAKEQFTARVAMIRARLEEK
ncbi:MAG: class I SAM-dependent methyltransferase [Aerococcus sp.]|nr:class I SAM-dependent methyltransferase [Aerococcus sp.]